MVEMGCKNEDMETVALKHCGVWFLVVGVAISTCSIFFSVHYSWTCLTEFIPGLLTSVLGIHLLNACNKCDSRNVETPTDSGRDSPFYYELEPSPMHRDLPPVPKDIGRDYDPIILDKV